MKKPLPEIFCSVSVLKKFWENFNKEGLDFENPNRKIYQSWLDLFLYNSHLLFDVSSEEMDELVHEHDFFRFLMKKKTEGTIRIDCELNVLETYIEHKRFSDFPKSIFILDKTTKTCKELEKTFGLLFLNTELMISMGRFVFSDISFSFSEGIRTSNDFRHWHDLSLLQLPCNQIILLDNHLLDNDNGIKDNLIPILDGLVPNEIASMDFKVILVTLQKDDAFLERKYTEIKEEIKKKLTRPFQIALFLLTTMKEFNHDRNMYTNYSWFNIGYGFGLFKGDNCIKPTTLVIKTAFLSAVVGDFLENTSYKLIYNELKKVNHLLENHIQVFCWSTNELKIPEDTKSENLICRLNECKPRKRMLVK